MGWLCPRWAAGGWAAAVFNIAKVWSNCSPSAAREASASGSGKAQRVLCGTRLESYSASPALGGRAASGSARQPWRHSGLRASHQA